MIQPKLNYDKTIRLRGAMDSTENAVLARRAPNVTFELGDIKCNMDLCVAPINDNLLLGYDFFDRYQTLISFKDKKLTILGMTLQLCVATHCTQDPNHGTHDVRRIKVGLEERVKFPPSFCNDHFR